MTRFKYLSNSPAVLVSALALVAAVAGTALAGVGPTANSAGKAGKALNKAKKALKKTKKNKKAIKNIELTPGPQGPQGQPGPAGPTFGANLGFATPVASPDDPNFPGLSANDSFSLPSPGRAFVSASFKSYRADCDAGIPRVGLYVDGDPIPGTERELQDNVVVRQLVVTGISEPLAAGSHELKAGVDCPDGSLGGRAAVFASASVILIGG